MAMMRVQSSEFRNIRFDLFLDRDKVQRAMDRKARRVLAMTGGFTRQAVRRSMRKAPKKKKVREGPPRWVTRGLKDNIFFFYDDRKKSVVIGPRPFKSTKTGRPISRRSGASLLEFGGVGWVRVLNREGRPWFRSRYDRRPFMGPQMPVAQAKLRENLRKVRFGV